MSVTVAARPLRSCVRTPPKHGCPSVVGVITLPEESLLVNEEVLTHYGLSHQVKYNINPCGPSPANFAVRIHIRHGFRYRSDHWSRGVVCEWGIDSQKAVTTNKIRCRADHSSRGIVCDFVSPNCPVTLTPNKIHCRSQRTLASWDHGFEFHRIMDVCLLSGWSLAKRSCVNKEVLPHRGLSHQIKYNVGHSCPSPVEIMHSDSIEAWMSICCADHSSGGIVACEWRGPDPLGAVTPNKIQCQSRCPLACWDRWFEFQQGMDVSYRSDH